MNYVPIDEISEIIRGVSYRRGESSETPKDNYLPILRAGNIQREINIERKLVWIPKENVGAKQILRKNDIIMCASSGSSEIVGKSALLKKDWIGSFGAFCLCLRVKKEKYDPRFLNYFFGTPVFKNWTIKSSGANIKNIRRSELGNFKIPDLPLTEQKRIVAILDKADDVCRKRQQTLDLADQFLCSVFLDMFGDPALNSRDWKKEILGNIIINKPDNGIFGKRSRYGKGIPVVWVDQLFGGNFLDISKSRRLEPNKSELQKFGLINGDILFCRSSLKQEGIGYNNIFIEEDGSALFECHLIRIRPNQKVINPFFLNFLLRTQNMRKEIIKNSNTVTMTTIAQQGIEKLDIILPPIENQKRFEMHLKKVEVLKVTQRKFLLHANNVFDSLEQRAFGGKL